MKLLFNFFKGKPKVVITAINIKWQGYQHSMEGMQVKGSPFTLSVPFQNKTHSDMLTDAAGFKAQSAKPMTIKSVEVAQPFTLKSVTPIPPITVAPDLRINLDMILEGPSYVYEGPLNLNLGSDVVETIHIELTKVVLRVGYTRTDIETSSRILNIPKGQIFSEPVQLLKAMSYGSVVNKIEIEKPFKFVSSEPKVPFRIDQTNSFIANIYVQAPESPYAGEMVISIG